MQNNFTWHLKFRAGGPTIFSQVTTIIKNVQCNGILNVTSFMQGSLSQISKFNQRKFNALILGTL